MVPNERELGIVVGSRRFSHAAKNQATGPPLE
jgi:hypothetical protein